MRLYRWTPTSNKIMRSALGISLIIASIIANTVPRWIPGIDGNIFCQFQALSFVIMSIAAISTNRENVIERLLWQYTIGLALNNLYDEVLGDPLHVGKIELTVVIFFTLCTLYRLRKCQQETNS